MQTVKWGASCCFALIVLVAPLADPKALAAQSSGTGSNPTHLIAQDKLTFAVVMERSTWSI
jgi:hypothetical protein